MFAEPQESAFTESQAAAYKAGLARFYRNDKVIGAGFYCAEGYVVTCAHIVTQALGLGKRSNGITPDQIAGKSIQVDFPFIDSNTRLSAEVVPEFWRVHDDDLAALKLTTVAPEPVQPIPLQASTYYRANKYHAYGFPEGHPEGIWTRGEFLGELTRGWIQLEGTKTPGVAIAPGFSGAPVWDESLKTVVGIAVAYDKDRPEAKVGFMVPYQKLKTALEAIALFNFLLPEAAKLESHWQAAYALLRPPPPYSETHPTTVQEAILQIQDMTPQGSSYRKIDQFIGYLALPELGLQVQPKLIQWLGEQQIDVNALLEAVRQKKDSEPTVSIPHLLFWVKAELNSDRYSVQAYLVKDRDLYEPLKAQQLEAPAKQLEQAVGEKVSRDQLEQILRECLEESVVQLPQGLDKLKVHIFLPLSCLTGLHWDVDCWFADEPDMYNPQPDAVGARYAVLMRVAERLDPKICKPQRHALWTAKWKALTDNQSAFAHQLIIPGDQESSTTLPAKLRDKLGFYLTRSPEASTLENPGLFPILIGTGAPVALWFREDLPDHCTPHFEQFLECCPSDLPAEIQTCRQQADQQCPDSVKHIQQHLSLILEDPKLVPPVPSQTPRMRSPT